LQSADGLQPERHFVLGGDEAGFDAGVLGKLPRDFAGEPVVGERPGRLEYGNGRNADARPRIL
jgi:hypothetical protein